MTAQEQPKTFTPIVLLGLLAALLAVVLFFLHLSLGHQLSLLHDPWPASHYSGAEVPKLLPGCSADTVKAGIADLRTDHARCAVQLWTRAGTALHTFHPAAALTVVRALTGVDIAFHLCAGAALLIMLRGARWKLFLYPLTGLWVIVGTTRALVDLAVMQGTTSPHLPVVFDYLDVVGRVAFWALVLGALLTNLNVLDRGIVAFFRSPATARLAAVTALVFAVMFHVGKIGAQSEDVMRRSLGLTADAPVGGFEAAGLARIALALLVYLFVVVAARRLHREPGHTVPLSGWKIVTVVAVAAVILAVAVHRGAWFAPLVIAVLTLVVVVTSRVLRDPPDGLHPPPPSVLMPKGQILVGVGILLLLVGVLGVVFDTDYRWIAWTVLALGVVLSVRIGSHNVVAWRRTGGRWLRPADENSGRWLYATAAVLPPLGIATLLARVLGGQIAADDGWIGLTVLIVVFLVAALIAAKLAGEDTPKHDGVNWPLTIAVVVVVLASVAVALGDGWWDGLAPWVGRTLGSLAVLTAIIATLAAVGGISRLVAREREPDVFRALYMQRTPILAIVAVWLLVQGVLGAGLEGDIEAHRVRIQHHQLAQGDAASCHPTSGTLADQLELLFGDEGSVRDPVAIALCGWLTRQARVTQASGDRPVPLVLVSGSGGGVRAAAWTMRVLDCAFLPRSELLRPADGDTESEKADPCGRPDGHRDAWPLVFAAGGASGGSVGIVSTVAERIAPVDPGDGRVEWLRRLADPDHVAPLLAAFAYGDGFLSSIGMTPDRDRAAVLADSWAEPFGGAGKAAAGKGTPARCPNLAGTDLSDVSFLQARRACPKQVPLMVLNGTIVADGSRFDISPLQYRVDGASMPTKLREEDSLDLRDVLCAGDDISLIDAGFLSGRFPLVTPSGHLPKGDPKRSCGRRRSTAVQVVDGGYAENDGTAQILELWEHLGPLLTAYNDRIIHHRIDEYRRACAVFVEIENGEHGSEPHPVTGATDDPGCTRVRGDATKLPKLIPAPTESKDKAIGEPLRIPEAFTQVTAHGGNATKASTTELERQLGAAGVPIVRFALYEHPGRVLPLGWSLTDGILDDIDGVYALSPNRRAATTLRKLLCTGAGDPSRCAWTL